MDLTKLFAERLDQIFYLLFYLFFIFYFIYLFILFNDLIPAIPKGRAKLPGVG
jgi:hypothetical protein